MALMTSSSIEHFQFDRINRNPPVTRDLCLICIHLERFSLVQLVRAWTTQFTLWDLKDNPHLLVK
jgi:hypothetical protein